MFRLREPEPDYSPTTTVFSFKSDKSMNTNGNSMIKMEILPEEEHENLHEKFKYLLRFGKVIGCHPTGTRIDKVIRIIPLLLGTVAMVDLVGIALLKPDSIRTATEIAGDFGVPAFYCLGTFLYYHIQRNIHQLEEIFTKWGKLKIKHPDRHLKRFVNLSSVCILTSAILENATFHFKLFPVFDSPETLRNTSASALEVYYERSHEHWALYVPYNPVVAILLCVTNKWALYAWNYADVLIAVISRALYFRFSCVLTNPCDGQVWNTVWDEYSQLAELARLVEKFFSPIIFGCYTLNMYAISMQLHMWLTPSESHHYLHTLYLAWSFVHLLGRVLFVSISAAKVNGEVLNFQRKLRHCPEGKYETELERLEVYPKEPRRGIGLRGHGGCFVITKPFILSFFYHAFTFLVFLLQSDSIKVG